MNDDRYQRGMEKFREIHGEVADRVVQELDEVAPALARLTVEFPFADIYARPGLDLRTRQLATVAALTVLGNAPTQLQNHIRGAMNVGCTRQEIVEIIMQMAVYAGFPAAINAMLAAREVFEERDAPGRVSDRQGK